MLICGDSTLVVRPDQRVEGGSIPTSPLHLRKADYWVRDCPLTDAQNLVKKYHYAKGGSNTRTYSHGLYGVMLDELVGCAWWIPPTKSAGVAWAGDYWQGVLALSRLVITPGVPTNPCSFLLSKSVKLIDRDRWHTLVTYADDWQGHLGAIYKAAGWEYAGKTKPEATFTLNGVMIARKAGPKTRTRAEMAELGAKMIGRYSKSRWCLRSPTGGVNGR